jgi:hypothetical protein
MGLQMGLQKENNVLYYDFINAYWTIEDIRFSNQDGTNYTTFEFNAYPNREAYKREGIPFTSNLNFGGATSLAINPMLYNWVCIEKTSLLFPDGIPVSETEQKDILYPYLKSYLEITEAVDVFETTTE